MPKRKSLEITSTEFKHIRQLERESAKNLNKIRNDLLNSIEKVNRVHQAFNRELLKESSTSNRIRYIIDSLDVVQFQADALTTVVKEHITGIIFARNVRRRSKTGKSVKELKKLKEEQEILEYFSQSNKSLS